MASPVAAGRLSLPNELHAATRNEHATLNRTIFTRLPQCLPPVTSTPDLYAHGMTVISQIYYGIEEAWDTLLSDGTIGARDRSILTELDIPRLRRTERLQISLRQLRHKTQSPLGEQLPTLAAATTHFRRQTRQAILQQPHLLMAYTWTMYLALFNGGRWIARQLLGAGPPFWSDEERVATVNGALAFWFFGDSEDYDGEDIKVAFKERFNLVAEHLTDAERDEIVAESKKIFHLCAAMVEFLDQHVAASNSGAVRDPQAFLTVEGTTGGTAAIDGASVTANALGYLASFAPASIGSLWRSVFTAAASFPVSLRQNIEQKNG